MLIFPALLLGGCVGLAVWLHQHHYLPLSPGERVNGRLQEAIREALDMKERIDGLTTFGDVSVILVIFLAPLAVCLLLYPDEKFSRADRAYWFHLLLYGTALLLVVGVIQVIYQNRMPALFFDDEFNRQRVGEMASATGLLIGGVFTVALGLVFLPPGFRLAAPAESASYGAAPKGNWLVELLAVLAPVLAALPVGKLFELAG